MNSIEIIKDCVLENGAVVAANSDRSDYPSDAQNYRYVWPRDAAYFCVAAKKLGVTDFQEKFFWWLIERAEGVKDTGLIYQNYYVNGPKRWTALQIDQNGSMLWAITEFYDQKIVNASNKVQKLVKILADGILSVWNGKKFTAITQDLWEERFAYDEIDQFHSYSMAACIKGLRAVKSVDVKYEIAANQMEKILKNACSKKMVRTNGQLVDENPDASLLGLIWPFEIFTAESKEADEIIQIIEDNLVKENGVYRYVYDTYGGYRKYGLDTRRGGGAWPILNYWLAMVYLKRGDKDKAAKYVEFVDENCEGLIPEQIFENQLQISVKPLAWSHAIKIFYDLECRKAKLSDHAQEPSAL